MNIEHTEILETWTQEFNAGLWILDAGLWTLDSGRWISESDPRRYTLEAGLWTLDTVVDCCRTKSKPNF